MIVLSKEQAAGVFTGDVSAKLLPHSETVERRFEVGRSYSFGVTEIVEYKKDGRKLKRADYSQRGHVTVTLTGQLYLHELTDKAAACAGLADRKALFDFWREKHGDGPGTDALPTFLPVWVVCFALDREHRPRFLGRSDGYTSSPVVALRDLDSPVPEPEAVEDHYLDLFRATAARNIRDRWAKEDVWRRGLDLDDRLRLLREEARVRGVNVSKHLRVIAKCDDPAKVERRLDAIEEQLRAARGERAA